MAIGLWRIAARVHAAERLRYLVRLWLNWPWVAPLMRQFARSPFAALPLRDPDILNRVRRPYLAASWSRRRRLEVVGSHYRFLAQQQPLGLAGAVYAGDGVFLARLGAGDGDFELLLHYTPRFGHEGEVTLSLGRRGESRRLASLSFTIDATVPGSPRMLIGCLQSDGGEDTLESIRDFTRSHHGMRPKPLLIWAARVLAAHLQLNRVCGIRDACHVYQHPRYRHSKGAQLHSRYDTLWQEAGGIANGEWYELPCGEDRRDPAAIPSRKRALYARRYAWLDTLLLQLDCALAGLQRSQPLPQAPAPPHAVAPAPVMAAA